MPTAVLAPAAAVWAAMLSALVGGGRLTRPLLPVRTPARRRRATLAALVLAAGPALAVAIAWGGAWTLWAWTVGALLAADVALLMLAARRRQVLARVAARRRLATGAGPGRAPGTPARRAAAASVTSTLATLFG